MSGESGNLHIKSSFDATDPKWLIWIGELRFHSITLSMELLLNCHPPRHLPRLAIILLNRYPWPAIRQYIKVQIIIRFSMAGLIRPHFDRNFYEIVWTNSFGATSSVQMIPYYVCPRLLQLTWLHNLERKTSYSAKVRQSPVSIRRRGDWI